MRLPAASTPMSCIDTPASRSAPCAAWAARSTMSRSGCFPNFVIVIPRIQTSSVMSRSYRLEAESNCFGAGLVPAQHVRREPDPHADVDVVGRRLDVDDVGSHLRPVAIDHGRNERDI